MNPTLKHWLSSSNLALFLGKIVGNPDVLGHCLPPMSLNLPILFGLMIDHDMPTKTLVILSLTHLTMFTRLLAMFGGEFCVTLK